MVVMLGLLAPACSEDRGTPSRADAEASPSPSSAEMVEDLSRWAPPRFEEGALTVQSRGRSIEVYARPGSSAAPAKEIRARNPLGQSLRLVVLRAQRDAEGTGWFQVLLPERPNGSTGWVRSAPMKIVLIEDRIEIDMSEFEMSHYRRDRLLGTYEVGTGTQENPTPRGLFYVWASVPQPDPAGPYGAYALGLSGFAPNLSDWPGGGRAAIHGTTDPGDKGERVSHGCVRVFNPDMRKLKTVPLGTPVVIRA
jgi:hypothetical protein